MNTTVEPTLLEKMTRHAIDGAKAAVESTFAQLAEYKVSRIDGQWGALDPYLEALANRDIMVTVEKIWEFVGADGSTQTCAEALLAVAQERTDQLLNNYLAPRSTSVVANCLSAVEARMASSFVRSTLVRAAREGR